MRFRFFILLLAISLPLWVAAQPAKTYVQILIEPDQADWEYAMGEKATFSVHILEGGQSLSDAAFQYEIGPEQVDPLLKGEGRLKKGEAVLPPLALQAPGFLRCRVEVEVAGKKYSAFTTVAYEPERIQPTTTLSEDFQSFWEAGKAELAKIPVEPVLTLLPERCTDDVNVYHVRINNVKGYIYGILCTPKAPGKYPALLNVPGAGIRPYYGDVSRAEQGVITFQIGIHGLPVNLPQEVYDALGRGALNGYQMANLDDRDQYYYRRVYLGCVRAVDFLVALPEYDGQHIAVTGGSQGGALSIVTAGLDPRIQYLGAFYPALSDLPGYVNGRAGGWPHLFKEGYTDWTITEEKIETSKYYDVVNFARFVRVPGLYSWGFNDNVCPPTSMYAAYNVIPGAKELRLFKDTQHWTYPEQREMMDVWLLTRLKEEN